MTALLLKSEPIVQFHHLSIFWFLQYSEAVDLKSLDIMVHKNTVAQWHL